MFGWLKDWLTLDLHHHIKRIERKMATQQDIDNLVTRIDTVGTAVSTGVSNVRADIETLKAANPALDLSALESSVAGLEAGVTDLVTLDEENPAAPVDEPADDDL